MKEHRIMFTAAEVEAYLDGRKTQTRRPVKPQPVGTGPGGGPMPVVACYRIGGADWNFQSADGATQDIRACPDGQPGDRLWVAEAFQIGHATHEGSRLYSLLCPSGSTDQDGKVFYRASGCEVPTWRPSSQMPRWASRITLEITRVRVERTDAANPWEWVLEFEEHV